MATAIQNPYSGLPLSGGTVTGLTTFTNGLTVSGGNVTFASNIGTTINGNVDISGPGYGLAVAEGTNGKQGVTTLNGTTEVTVANVNTAANTRIFLTIQAPGGTPGSPYISSRVAGTSFGIKSTSATDTSTVAYEMFNPG